MLDGSHSIFTATEPDAAIRQRVADLDLHPTGPLWGAGELLSEGEARELEQAVAATLPVFRDGLAAEGLRQERRALRLRVQDAALEWSDSKTAVLNFRLTAGVYATAVLRELIQATD